METPMGGEKPPRTSHGERIIRMAFSHEISHGILEDIPWDLMVFLAWAPRRTSVHPREDLWDFLRYDNPM